MQVGNDQGSLGGPIERAGLVRKKGFAVEPGLFDILVGSSSDDIRLKGALTVAGKS